MRSTPKNRGGATSMTLAWQFLGSALAPLLFLPTYHADPTWSFVAAGVTAIPATVLVALPVRAAAVVPAPPAPAPTPP